MKHCLAALILSVAATPVLAADDGGHHHKNHVALLVGSAQEVEDGERTSGAVLGLVYERKLSHHWHFVANLEQEAFGDKKNRHTVVFAGASYGITDRWSVFGGPGVEGKKGGDLDKFLLRVGTGYNFPVTDRFSLRPEFAIDFVEGGTQIYILGVTLGYGF